MKQIYSTREAAHYLGITLAGLKYHLYRANNIQPDLRIGRTIAFRKSTLDNFQHTRKSGNQKHVLDNGVS